MFEYETAERIGAPAAGIFEFMAVRQPENHPRWEPEVLELRREGPAGLGAKMLMVRNDGGRRSELAVNTVEWEPGRRMAFQSGGPLSMWIAFTLTPVDARTTDLVVSCRVRPAGFFRLLTPILKRKFPKNSRQIVTRLKGLLEAEVR